MKKVFITFLMLIATFSITIAQDCNIPSQIESWDYYATKKIAEDRDWQNEIATDYWLLSLSWSKTFCNSLSEPVPQTNKHQCRDNSMGLIVHGLWAQSKYAGGNYKKHPRNCRDTEAIDTDLIKKYICVVPGTQLMQKEWEKHGTCDFNTPEEYFATLNVLFKQLNIPSREELEKFEYEGSAKIKSYFVNYNKSIGLKENNVKIIMESDRLKEIHVIYDKEFNFFPVVD